MSASIIRSPIVHRQPPGVDLARQTAVDSGTGYGNVVILPVIRIERDDPCELAHRKSASEQGGSSA